MARCPIVRPDVKRLDLTDGDFLDVKKRLNTGEYRSMVTKQYQTSGDRMSINLDQMGLSKVIAYVVGWSFVDLSGAPLPVNEQTIKASDPDVFREVLEAVEGHEAAMDAEREQEKNAKAGMSLSAAI